MVPRRSPARHLQINHPLPHRTPLDELPNLPPQLRLPQRRLQLDPLTRSGQPIQMLRKRKRPPVVDTNHLIHPIRKLKPSVFDANPRLSQRQDFTIQPDHFTHAFSFVAPILADEIASTNPSRFASSAMAVGGMPNSFNVAVVIGPML